MPEEPKEAEPASSERGDSGLAGDEGVDVELELTSDDSDEDLSVQPPAASVPPPLPRAALRPGARPPPPVPVRAAPALPLSARPAPASTSMAAAPPSIAASASGVPASSQASVVATPPPDLGSERGDAFAMFEYVTPQPASSTLEPTAAADESVPMDLDATPEPLSTPLAVSGTGGANANASANTHDDVGIAVDGLDGSAASDALGAAGDGAVSSDPSHDAADAAAHDSAGVSAHEDVGDDGATTRASDDDGASSTDDPSHASEALTGTSTGDATPSRAAAETVDPVVAAVERLRAEVDATSDRTRKARLLHEAGEMQERGGDEQGAARDYLAAYNTDTSFREPLEGLVRLLERRRSLANLGKLVEALVVAASTPDERARALTERAVFLDEVQQDLEGARGAAREATESGAKPADLGAAWLTLELVSAKLGDAAQREEALAGRAELTLDPTWRGLLLVDVANLAAASGDIARALDVAALARSEGGTAAWHASAAAERIIRAEPGLSGSDEARARARFLAALLEERAELIQSTLTDVARGDAAGVPHHARTAANAVSALLSASEARRASGESALAAQALDRALAILTAHRSTDERPLEERARDADDAMNFSAISALEGVTLNARLRLAEAMGDAATAAELATRRMASETDAGLFASLALRVAEHARSEGDTARALDVLSTATERDALSAPARALKLDLLASSDESPRFAEELEELSKHFANADAQGRALLLAAYVWAARANDGVRARTALGQAEACGVGKDLVARFGRSLASLRKDDAWYEDATRSLIAYLAASDDDTTAAARNAELPSLWIEVARLRLAQGDEAGAAKATAALGTLPDGALIARILEGFTSTTPRTARAADGDGPDDGEAPNDDADAIAALTAATSDPATRRSLAFVGILRAHVAGGTAIAAEALKTLAAEDPADPVVAAYLGDLLRTAGNRAAVAEVALAVGEASEDVEFRAARLLEAGFEAWKLANRSSALSTFEGAAAAAPEAAEPVLGWAARAVDVDTLDGRRRALDLAGNSATSSLERFALEATTGDPDDAATALANVELAASPSLRLAAALGRLAWPRGGVEHDAMSAALDALAATGPNGANAAAAERVRIAREQAASPETDDVAAAASAWLDVGGGTAAAMEWLAAAMTTADAAKEIPARRALAERLTDEARESLHASATLLDAVLQPDQPRSLVAGSSPAVRLANLELAPPGCDPRRRATTLAALDGVLGEDAELSALGLAGWSQLAAGEAHVALDLFRTVAASRATELHAWEGMRAAAEQLGDREAYAVACEQLGARSSNDARGAAFWEYAALAWLELAKDGPAAFDQRAEASLDASFARDASREVAFDKLFRRVRDRKDGDKLLALVGRRLEVTDDPSEIAKMYWEMARVLREKGDPDGALEALEHVTMFDENHVGALALTGEIFIRRGMFAEAAEKLARLARIEAAPPKNRVTAGVAAVDLYENKLAQHDLALEVLVGLHRAKLTTLPVRERLARAAARTGSWREATQILEELMVERPEKTGRIEAARLALAIYRDKLQAPGDAVNAATKLLSEAPADGEALDLVLGLDAHVRERKGLLERGRDAVLLSLHETPSSLDAQRRLARIARAVGDQALEQSALACSLTLSEPDGATEQLIALLSGKKPRVPQVALTEPMLRQILAPGDEGPLSDLFVALGPTLAEALGPSLTALGVHPKKDRVDPRAGLSLRNEIASWAGAFGISNFDLYIGGKDPNGVQGIPGETPALVVGSAVNAPLSPTTRARVARELLCILRGTAVTRFRDDTTIAAIVVAACNLTKVRVDHPPFAVLAEVERVIGKAIARKTKAVIEPICQAFVQSHRDAKSWAARARASQGRVAALASGDVSVVLADVFGEPTSRLHTVVRDDVRAHELLRFVLSRPYFDLRRALGLEG